jgi:hypothetical protein
MTYRHTVTAFNDEYKPIDVSELVLNLPMVETLCAVS